MLQDQITSDIKDAMRAKDTIKLGILRVLKGDLQRAENTMADGKVELNDDFVLGLISKTISNIKDNATKREKARGSVSTSDEIAFDKAEIEALQIYLPKQLSDDEVKDIVDSLIESTGATSMKQMGQVVGQFKAKYNGLANMGLVSGLIKAKLA